MFDHLFAPKFYFVTKNKPIYKRYSVPESSLLSFSLQPDQLIGKPLPSKLENIVTIVFSQNRITYSALVLCIRESSLYQLFDKVDNKIKTEHEKLQLPD